MSTDRTCNSSFWTKEEDKIFENTLGTYFEDDDLLTKMEEALPWKSRGDIINHYNILIEDIDAIESGRVPLPNNTEMQSHSNQKSRFSKSDLARRKGIAWTEEEHRSFLRGLAKYGRGDWRSISRHCVISRTSMQVASHAQKYFKRLNAVNKENRRTSIHDITSVGAEAAGTSLVPNTEDMIWPSCRGSQAVASSSNESMLPRERNNAEQMMPVAGGESSGHSAAFVNGINSLYPDENDEFILRIDDLIVDPEDANEAGFLVDAGSSLLPSKQPCTAASTRTCSHPITIIGSELEALITKQMDEDYDFTSIFDVGEAPTSRAMLSNADHSGMTSFAAASVGANNAPQNMVADYSGMTSYAVAGVGANNAPQNPVADYSGMTSFPVASFGANNAPQNTVFDHSRMCSYPVASFGANNAPQNMVADYSGMNSFAVASIGAYNAPQNTVADYSGMTSFAVASVGAYNAPQNRVADCSRRTSFTVASVGAYNAPQNRVADYSGMTSFAVASIGASNAPQNRVADCSGMTSFAVASVDANNAPQNRVADCSRRTSFAVASVGAYNAPQNRVADYSRMTSFAVASIGASNAPQNMVAAHPQLPPVAPSSNSGVGFKHYR